jgi:hypothetical protein
MLADENLDHDVPTLNNHLTARDRKLLLIQDSSRGIGTPRLSPALGYGEPQLRHRFHDPSRRWPTGLSRVHLRRMSASHPKRTLSRGAGFGARECPQWVECGH